MLIRFCVALIVTAAVPAFAVDTSWVEKSNDHAQVVLEVLAKYSPEGAGSFGVDGLDEEIFDLGPRIYERAMADSAAILEELQGRLADESHPKVRQDLEILVQAIEDNMASSRLNRDHLLPYYNITQTVFFGVRSLVDPQVPRERYPAAITRINKYAGLTDGFTPITELAKERTRERFDVEGLVGPYRGEVEQDLERAGVVLRKPVFGADPEAITPRRA